MLKKVTSVVIALIMLCSVAIIPASAVSAEDKILSDAQVEAAVEIAVSALIDADEEAKVFVSDSLSDEIADEANTAKEVSWALAQFIFVEKSQVEEFADLIVADSKFTVGVLEDGKTTVYIAVSLVKNPELYDARVFLSVVDKLQKKCDEVALSKEIDISGDNYNPMSYAYIAGELALHMILADFATLAGAGSWNRFLDNIYLRISTADLNIDEARFPFVLMELVGKVITAIFDFLFIN